MNQYDRQPINQQYYSRVEMLIMPTRNEAAISTTLQINAPQLPEYLKTQNLRFFPYVLYACIQTVNLHPNLKKFVMGQRVYSHRKLWISTVIKQDKNNENSNNLVKFELTETMQPHDVQQLLDQLIDHTRNQKPHNTDQLMRWLALLPNIVFKLAIKIATKLDQLDLLPNAIIDSDPLHTGLVIANLGSIKGQSVNHHLFNWGTCSMVITIGELTKTGKVDISFAVDERIAEGVAFFRAIETMKSILENPYADNV